MPNDTVTTLLIKVAHDSRHSADYVSKMIERLINIGLEDAAKSAELQEREGGYVDAGVVSLPRESLSLPTDDNGDADEEDDDSEIVETSEAQDVLEWDIHSPVPVTQHE